MARGTAEIRMRTRGHQRVVRNVQRVSGVLGGLASAATGIGFAFGAMELGKQAREMAELAGRVKAARESFARLATTAGRDAAQDMARLREASGGVMSDLKMLQTAVEAVNAGLDFDNMVTAMEFVRRFSESTGKSFEVNWRKVMTGLVRESARFLDDVGINVMGAEDVVGAALDQMREKMGNLGASGSNASIEMQRFSAEMENLKGRVGALIEEPFGDWLRDISTWLSRIGKSELEERIDDLRAMGVEAEYVKEQMEALAELKAIERPRRAREALLGFMREAEEASTMRQTTVGERGMAWGLRDPGPIQENIRLQKQLGEAARVALTEGPGAGVKYVEEQIEQLLEAAKEAGSDTAVLREQMIQWYEAMAQMEALQPPQPTGGGGEGEPGPGFGGEDGLPDVSAPPDVRPGATDWLGDFRRKQSMLNAEISLGRSGLEDYAALIEEYRAELSFTEEGTLALTEAEADLHRRRERQAGKESAEQRNVILEQAQQMLGTGSERLLMEEEEAVRRTQSARAYLEAQLEMNELRVKDEERIRDRIAELDEQLTRQQIQNAERLREQYVGVIETQLQSLYGALKEGENAWEAFRSTAVNALEEIIIKIVATKIAMFLLNLAVGGGGGGAEAAAGAGGGSVPGVGAEGMIAPASVPGGGGGGAVGVGPKGGLAGTSSTGGSRGIGSIDLSDLPVPGSGNAAAAAPVVVIESHVGDAVRFYERHVKPGERGWRRKFV